MAEYKLNPAAFRDELLNADWMVAKMSEIAATARGIAEANAPFDPNDPDGRHYREAFHVTAGKRGGVHHDRAWAHLENDSTTPRGFSVALAVEFGTKNNPAHHTVMDAVREAVRRSTDG